MLVRERWCALEQFIKADAPIESMKLCGAQ
jgi:hypothetical protein